MLGNFYYIACCVWLKFWVELNILSLFVKLQSWVAHNKQHNPIICSYEPPDPIREIISKVVTGLHYDWSPRGSQQVFGFLSSQSIYICLERSSSFLHIYIVILGSNFAILGPPCGGQQSEHQRLLSGNWSGKLSRPSPPSG